jgi:hypothetical protein
VIVSRHFDGSNRGAYIRNNLDRGVTGRFLDFGKEFSCLERRRKAVPVQNRNSCRRTNRRQVEIAVFTQQLKMIFGESKEAMLRLIWFSGWPLAIVQSNLRIAVCEK